VRVLLCSRSGHVIVGWCPVHAWLGRFSPPKRALEAAYARKTPDKARRPFALHHTKQLASKERRVRVILCSRSGYVIVGWCPVHAWLGRFSPPKRALEAAYARKTPDKARRPFVLHHTK